MFGFRKGKAKAKDTAGGNGLQAVRDQQVSMLKAKCPSVVEESATLYNLPLPLPNDTFLMVTITLPSTFPSEAPSLRVTPPVQHQWVSPDGYITGHPKLGAAWNMHINLGIVVQEIETEFTSNPPPILSTGSSAARRNPPPPDYTRPPDAAPPQYGGGVVGGGGGGVTSMTGLSQSNPMGGARGLTGYYTGGGAGGGRPGLVSGGPPAYSGPASMVSPMTGMSGPGAGAVPPVSTLPGGRIAVHSGLGGVSGGGGGGVNGGDMPTSIRIPSSFPELDNLSRTELARLDSDHAELRAFVDDLDLVKNIVAFRRQLKESNEKLASENVSKAAALEEAKAATAAVHAELATLQAEYEDLYRRQHSVMERYSPLVLSNLLGAAMDQADTESEDIGDAFLSGDVEVRDFVKDFVVKRKVYHARAAKKARMDAQVMR